MSGHIADNTTMNESVDADGESPIKQFGLAKTRIGEIFTDINKYVSDSSTVVYAEDMKDIVKPQHIELVKNYLTKTAGILDMVQRNCMKVAFFGRTSNGKSSVVNAMLKGKFLPSGIGHTTNCFVQVEGTDQSEAYIITEDKPDVKQSVQSLSHLASALSKVKLDSNSLIRICWPKNKCRLLRDDVIFVDSPGIDLSPDMDCWIDKFCLDADVFVLVVNAESTLMQTEKNFFHHVATRLSKPNIFILNNRWDASANEPETINEVRQQHMERDIAFLSKELSVIDEVEAANRIFFVSALEILEKSSPSGHSPGRQLLDGWQQRAIEFNNFEHKFEECITQSALVTKFAQHVTNATSITSELKNMWLELYTTSVTNREEHQKKLDDVRYRLEFLDVEQKVLLTDLEDEIRSSVTDVYQKMLAALSDEIQRLSRVLEEFDRQFDPDPTALTVYKKELHFHVEECLSRNLHVRCSGFVHNILRTTNQHMNDSVARLLSSVTQSPVRQLDVHNVSDFEMSYHLDCTHLLADFSEDIEFHFSLGLTSLARRFIGPSSPRRLAGQVSHKSDSTSDSVVAILGSFTSIYSGTTIGSLAVVAVVTKSVGWKVIMACAAAYCALYIYERVTWTAKAKYDAFRRQYINYTTNQLNLVVGIVTENCSTQVHRELLTTYDMLRHHVDVTKTDLHETFERLREDTMRLDNVVTNADKLRQQASSIDSKLSAFNRQFLKPSR